MMMWTVFHRLLLYPHLLLIALEDRKRRKIPGALLRSLLCQEGALLLLESIFQEDSGVLLEAVKGFLAGGGAAFLLYLVTRGGIGAGDVKLLTTAGLCLGSRKIIEAQILAMFLACPACMYLFFTKRCREKQSIPLAPFFLAGILLADCLWEIRVLTG
ncbi:MAG: prepilin peptidase [Lachnospiraceae bacterium]|nr:prepilin peptidase [Lachnospiraceae bacterium]